jgi:hypothetical protein
VIRPAAQPLVAKRLARVSALTLAVFGAAITFVGLFFLLYAITFNDPCDNVPVCRSPGLVGFAMAGGILLVAVLHAGVAVGVWRGRRWALPAGVGIAVVAALFALSTMPRALTPYGASLSDVTGRMEPSYDRGALVIALCAIPYVFVLVALMVSRSYFGQPRADR